MVNILTMNQLFKYPWLKWYVSNLNIIDGGTYRWGASPNLKETGTRISISRFWMGATPVTWGMWKEYCKSKSVRMPSDPGWGYPDAHPVVNVSWNDIMKPGGFCEWVSSQTTVKFTLPTEAQWEYAARGGRDGLEYPWGNEFDTSKLWYSAKQTGAVDRTNRIYRNGYGLTDMVGNVLEWCFDYYDVNYRPTGIDPVDTRMSYSRCNRGGSWYYSNPDFFRCAYRYRRDPSIGTDMKGFRLCA